jgi:hypothetical protein
MVFAQSISSEGKDLRRNVVSTVQDRTARAVPCGVILPDLLVYAYSDPNELLCRPVPAAQEYLPDRV